MVIRQQNYVESRNIHHSVSTRTICGPFDTQFKKKFLGRQIFSVDTEKKRLTQQPFISTSKLRFWESQTNLLPKIKEIQKIAKSNTKKRPKINQYVDGVSDLQMYIAKKLIDGHSTAEIISKIQQPSAETAQKINLPAHRLQNQQNQTGLDQKQIANTNQFTQQLKSDQDFSQAHFQQKFLSDRQFIAKFDKFIVRRREKQKVSVRDMLGGDKRQFTEQIRQKIIEDRQIVTAIVRRMINQRANFVELDGQDPISSTFNKDAKTFREKKDQVKNIQWILRECGRFQTRFRNRKLKNKSKTKVTPKLSV